MNIYLPEERFVEQVPGDVFDDGSVAGEDGLGIDNLKKLKNNRDKTTTFLYLFKITKKCNRDTKKLIFVPGKID